MVNRLLHLVVLLLFANIVDSACNWPDPFISSTWTDGFKDELVFSTDKMTGWDVTVANNLVVNEWECFRKDLFGSDGYLEMKTTQTFSLLQSSTFYGYLCLKMTKITASSYRYYIHAPNQPNLDTKERLHVDVETKALSEDETSCWESEKASDSEYHVMIKSGLEKSAKIDCPYIFLGVYGYSITTDTGVISCDTTSSDWEICADTSTMAFDKEMCQANVAYTDASNIICVDSVPVGTDHLVTAYSSEPGDNTNTFSFSCFAISYDGTKASVSSRTCKEGQTPGEIPLSSNGSPDGATITMTETGGSHFSRHRNEKCLRIYKCPTCPVLPDISGGTVVYLTDGTVTYATYTCDDQYDLYGSQSRPCQADYTWGGEEPSCKCKAPTPPANGNVSVSADGNIATYTCDVGFVLKGIDTRVCQETNAWDGEEPFCDSCDTITPPMNGTYTLVQKGDITTAIFSCVIETTMVGSNISTCQSDATWDNTPPTCVTCEIISFGTSGSMILATDGMVTTAVFNCSDGYVLVGEGSLSCNTDGMWNNIVPICECSTPATPTNSEVQSDGSVAVYSCLADFNMFGESKRYCQNDGSDWNGTAPSCEKCAEITIPSGGSVNISTDGQVSKVEFTCESGYTLKGQSSATCQQTLEWDQMEPGCVSCQQLDAIPSGNFTMSTDGLVTIANYSCADGYTMEGTAVLTCGTDGAWSSTPPTCDCILPSSPSNGAISPSSDNTLLYYYCDKGFSLSTSSILRTCMEDGSGWSGDEPSCLECPALTAPEGGTLTIDTDKTKTIAYYNCTVGFSMSGEATVVCTTQGTWVSTNTICTKCADIAFSPGRTYTTETDGSETSAKFTCDTGYSLNGTNRVSCDKNGYWNPSLPTCAKCSDKQDPASGRVNVTTDGQTTTATYGCHDGYYLDGAETLECRPDSFWDGPDPVCKCIPPFSPGNGFVKVLSNDKIAVYSCDIGFTLNGSAERKCADDGTGWSDTDPACVTCDTIPDTSGGYFNLTSSGSVTQVKFTCPDGSTINGESTLTCGSDGAWGVVSFPMCELCPDLQSPTSGSINISSDGSLSRAVFDCLPEYELDGEKELTCQSNGEWDFTAPLCVCKAPVTPGFGSTILSSDPLTVSYTCEIGYTLKGGSTRMCLDDGTGWNGTDPSCVTCPEVSVSDDVNVNLTTTGTQTEAAYACNIGSSLKGTPQSKCLQDGTWEVIDSPTCVSCGPLADPATGSVTMTTDGVITIATYTCLQGYEVAGTSITSCQTNGEWKQTDIQCYCIPPDIPLNGSFTLSQDRSTALFSCDEGFTLTGSASRTCLPDGSGWTESSPTCTYCESLPDLSGGNITLHTNGTVTVAKLSCDQGYTITGSAGVTCQDDGTWDISVSECVSCPAVDPPQSGNVSVTTNGTVSTANFSCATGYDMVGQAEISCGVNGLWSNEYPTCVCSPPADVLNGRLNITSATVIYSCDLGYSINGNVIRTCQEDGSGWTGTEPSCVGCEALDTPQLASLNLTSDGAVTSATFVCDVGATIDGETALTCQSDGTWNDVIPDCVQCPNRTNTSNGAVHVTSNGTVTAAIFTCAHAYDIVGVAESYCRTDGTWSSETPICICRKSDVPAPINGSRTISADGQVVVYSCDAGFTLKGNVERVCQNDSSGWNGTSPTCVSCPSLESPMNGTVTITTNGSSTTAEYACSVGTTMNGQQYLTCLEYGFWDSSSSTCVQCSTLLRPASGNVTITTDRVTSVATYSCWDKYKIVGVTERRCLTDGSWDQREPHCTCEEPPTPENGGLVISSLGLRDYATYTCNTNFTINGPSIRQCGANGEYWDGSDPACVACQLLPGVANGTMSFGTNGVETFVNVACGVGSSMSGSNKVQCNSDGSWNSSLPVCNKCDAVPAAANGQFSLQTDGITTAAILGCSKGYEVTGTGSVSCDSDGSWSIVGEQTCSKVVAADDKDNPLLAALIAVSVVAAVVIAVLSAVLARFVYLYIRRRRRMFGDGTYKKYETDDEIVDGHNTQLQNGGIRREPTYIHPPPSDLIGIPLVPFEKTQAPLSHEQHVLERGKTSISLAPWSHQSHVMESKTSPRGVAPADTDVESRTPSQASISQVDILSMPPLPSIIRPPSSKTVKTVAANGKLNNVKLIHNSSKHLVGKPKKKEDSSRPMTPVNF